MAGVARRWRWRCRSPVKLESEGEGWVRAGLGRFDRPRPEPGG
jgi:hypothetical protein